MDNTEGRQNHLQKDGEEIGCIVVLGMHRSGTSIVAGVLKTLGVNMGTRFRTPDEHNKSGYFEDLDWRDLNKKILSLTGHSWYNPPLVSSVMSVCSDVKDDIVNLVNDRSDIALWGWKDPRNCLTISLIHRFLPNPFYVVVSRNTDDTIDSLETRALIRGYHESRQHWEKLVKTYNERRINFILRNRVQFCGLSYESLTSKSNVYENVLGLADIIGQKDIDIIKKACSIVRTANG